MPSDIRPIQIWGDAGPNPRKVAIILKELDLPYETNSVPVEDVKKPDFLAINPNGRIPAIHDPNTDLALWESGAIIGYLIERYDTQHRLSFAPGTSDSYYAKQWFFFQATGQGPYYGQASWFKKYHYEQLPTALERYVKEVNRVTGVLEGHLAAKQEQSRQDGGDSGGPWLVGNKMSYADLAFVPYQTMIYMILSKEEYNEDNFPHVRQWLGRMHALESVQSVYANSLQRLQVDKKS